jgi:hypothetical protein
LKNGVIVTYKCYSSYSGVHVLENGLQLYVAKHDGTAGNGIHEYDVIEQVLDKPLDELIEEGTKQIKENDDAIAEEKELQRRQEVVELAEKMYIMFENEILRYGLSRNGSSEYPSEKLMGNAIIRAASFINRKQKYLKYGKLC